MTSKQAFKELKERLSYGYYIGDQLETIEKDLEILEIIKKKRVFVAFVLNAKDVNDYNEHTHWDNNDLTQTEFNLIKEWLGR